MEVPAFREGANGALTFGIRPEHVALDDSASAVGTPDELSDDGSVVMANGNATFVVRLRPRNAEALKRLAHEIAGEPVPRPPKAAAATLAGFFRASPSSKRQKS